MKTLEKDSAIALRKQGKTFAEILKEVPVSKGSLSYWLRDVTLTPEQIARIEYKNSTIKEKFIRFNELKKAESQGRKSTIINKAIDEIGNISARELKLIGIALYWAEGHKAHARSFDFVNTDAAMIKLMMRWLRRVCQVREEKFRIRLHVHDRGDLEEAKTYWSGITGVPITQFTQAYTRVSPSSKRKFGNLAPYGICSIRVSDINLITRIQGWIKGIMALSSSLV